jgi:outer membrane receptor protein involved in Fe transport
MVDVFTEYKLSKDITLWATVENLTDQYYVDPLSLIQQPGPGPVSSAEMGLFHTCPWRVSLVHPKAL